MRTSTGAALVVHVLLVSAAWSADGGDGWIPAFCLETVTARKVLGPFLLQEGARAKIADEAFRLIRHGKKAFTFQSLADGEMYGPYDYEPGRIIRVGGYMYTVVKLDKVREQARPSGAGAPALSESAPEKPVRTSRPGAQTSAREPKLGLEPAGRGSRASNWLADGEAGIVFDLLNSSEYAADLEGRSSKPGLHMDRNAVGLRVQTRKLMFRLGLTMMAEWDTSLSGAAQTFRDVKMDEGEGWHLSMGFRHDLLDSERWHVELAGDVTYANETYTLSYGGWRGVETIVATNDEEEIADGPVTNGTVVTRWVYDRYERDAQLTEFILRLGGDLRYTGPVWSCYAGIRMLALMETDLDASIDVDGRKFDIDLERDNPVAVVAGVSAKAGSGRFFVEGEVGDMELIRVGGAWVF